MIARLAGSGRPLVLLHGFGLDHHVMLPIEEAVDSATWRSIYIDLPWVEPVSSHPTGSAAVADGVLAEIDAHLGGEPFAIIGNSYGGMLARYIAHERKDQVLGLATLAGVVEPVHARRSVPARTVLRRDPAVLQRAGDARAEFEEVSVIQDAENFAAFEQYVLPGVLRSNAAVMDRIAADYALPAAPEVQYPEPFTAPALHLFGRQDDVVGYEDGLSLREHYLRGSFVILDAAGHNVHLEQPAVTMALISDWLHRIDAFTLTRAEPR